MLPTNKHTDELKNIIEIIIAIIILANRNKNEEQKKTEAVHIIPIIRKNGPNKHLFPGDDGFGTNQIKTKQKQSFSFDHVR